MQQPQTAITEEREELIVSPSSESRSLRTARFILPSVSSTESDLPKLPPSAFFSVERPWEPRSSALNITFQSWRSRPGNWATWVEKMASFHQLTWRKAGIYEAVLNSTCQIKRNNELVIGLVEKWCCETKSFIFPWGEASVTLEDVMVLGGFSVLGSPVFKPLESERLKKMEASLKDARIEMVRTKAKKASPTMWMETFMDSGSEFEHEAFLACWLSRYVFVNARETIREHVLPLAIHLARGTRIALAPAVLACIYRDLCSLKDAIVSSVNLAKEEVLAVTLWSPFHLVQVWTWERFPQIRPEPNVLKVGEPRLCRWREVNRKIENVRLALDSAKESFEWRPYTKPVENWKFAKFYGKKETHVSPHSRVGKELESFARCLRSGELVGLDCLEQYLPVRVAMQFGMDQDVPDFVVRSTDSPETAWSNYIRPLGDVKLCIPSQSFRAGVTIRYSVWWLQSVLGLKNGGKSDEKAKRSLKGSKNRPQSSTEEQQEGYKVSSCTGLHIKRERSSPDSLVGKTQGTNTSSSITNVRRKSLRKQADDKIVSDSSSPVLKSKTMVQLLEGDKLGNDGSMLPASGAKTSKRSRKNLRTQKKDLKIETPDVPLNSFNEYSHSLKRKKGVNRQSPCPNPPQKRLKQSAENSKQKKEDKPHSGSGLDQLKTTKISEEDAKEEQKNNGEAASPGPSSKCSKKPVRMSKRKKGIRTAAMDLAHSFNGEEAGVPIEENNPTIAEMLRSANKRNGTRHGDGDEPGNSPSFSSTVADDEATNQLQPLAILAEKVVQDEAGPPEGSGRIVEGACGDGIQSKKSQEDAESIPGRGSAKAVEVANNNVNGKEVLVQRTQNMGQANGEGIGSGSAVGISKLMLEDRVSRLERLVMQLQASKMEQK